MNTSFNNGKPGILNQDLFGVFTIEEEGILQAQSTQVDLDIINSNLIGAGEFEGTKAKGKNPTFFEDGCVIKWSFSPPEDPHVLFLDLPPSFENGENTGIHGEIDATCKPIPEKSSPLSLLLLAVISIFVSKFKRSVY